MQARHTLHTDARLGRAPSQLLSEHVIRPRLGLDLAMFESYLAVDRAHVVMLVQKELIDRDAGRDLLVALEELRADGPRGLDVDARRGTLLFQVEHRLSERLGEATAGLLHLARSQIDQGAAFHRLFCRDRLLDLLDLLSAWQATLLERAAAEADTLMPGYTHLQHAQPWTLGHYLHAQAARAERDADRLLAAYHRTNLSALGSVALAGTSWDVDRELVARLLGHDAVVANAHDAGFFTMDFVAELAGSLAILLGTVGRLAADLDVWSTYEHGLVELDAALCGTSSNMPQKRNNYALERIRAVAAEATGWLSTHLAVSAMPSSTSCDLAFSSGELPSWFARTEGALCLATEVVSSLRFDRQAAARAAGANWSTASHLADELVRRAGLDFRTAHGVVGTLVRRSLAASRPPVSIGPTELGNALREHGLDADLAGLVDVAAALDPVEFVRTRTSAGGLAPDEVQSLLAASRRRLDRQLATLADARGRVRDACAALDREVAAIVAG